jgi:hypothetical protein
MKKNWLNRLEFFKKPTSSVRFWFYKPETKKTERGQTQTEKNRAKPEKPSQTRKKTGFYSKITEPNRNRSVQTSFCSDQLRFVFGFFRKKNLFGYFFLIKTKPN